MLSKPFHQPPRAKHGDADPPQTAARNDAAGNVPADETVTVAQMVTSDFSKARVFERFGIDYCCGGKVSLKEACARVGANISEVETALADAGGSIPAALAPRYEDWSSAELCAHIVAVHHAYLRSEIPRILELFAHVAGKHGAEQPELIAAQNIFKRMSTELLEHLESEERDLFPHCDKQLSAEEQKSRQWLLDVLQYDHADTGDDLLVLRKLLDGYRASAGLCRKRLALLHALAQFEQDMRAHGHKENNILFPRLREQ